MEFIKNNQRIVAIVAFCVVSIAMLLISSLALKETIILGCIVLVLEAGMAALLNGTELWIHGVLVLAEIIAGLLTGKLIFVVLMVVIYIAATLALNFYKQGEY